MKKILIAGFAASAMLLSAPSVFAGAMESLVNSGDVTAISQTKGSNNNVTTDAAGIDVGATGNGASIVNPKLNNSGTVSATSNTGGSNNTVKTTASGISMTAGAGGSIRNISAKNTGDVTAKSHTRGAGNTVSTSASGVRVHAGK